MSIVYQNKAILDALSILNNPRLITIDGNTGAGKTTLALYISKSMDIDTFDLDNYLQKKDDLYWNKINYDRLLSDLNSHGHAILSGVCMNAVLERLGMTSDFSIYVDTMNKHEKTDNFLEYMPKQHIHSTGNGVCKFCLSSKSIPHMETPPQVNLTASIKNYHIEYNPSESCNLCLIHYSERISESDRKELNPKEFSHIQLV